MTLLAGACAAVVAAVTTPRKPDMTKDTPSLADERLYVIRKYGMFYRPNAAGYTPSEAEAGLYTLAEAIKHSHPNGPDGPRDGITYRLVNIEALRTRPTEARAGGDALRERDAMFLRGHAAGLREAEWDEEDGDAAKCEAIADKISALSHPTPAADARTPDDVVEEWEDEIADAIADSFDVEWTARDGARQVVGRLQDYGVLPTATPAALTASGDARERALRPIAEAAKDGSIIWAVLRDDIYPTLKPERSDLERWNGVQVPLRHPGLADDGFDVGWVVAAPVGHSGFPDEWIAGWCPLLDTPPAGDGGGV